MDTPATAADPAAPPAAPKPAFADLDAGDTFGSVTIPLARPFKLAGREYRELAMRLPTAGEVDDAQAVDKSEKQTEWFDALATSLCGLPPGALRKIYVNDRARVYKRLGELSAGVLSGA